jgi:hypothetical protein
VTPGAVITARGVAGDDERFVAGQVTGVEHGAVRKPYEVLGVLGAAVDFHPAHDPRVGESPAQAGGLGEKRHVVAVVRERRIGDRHEVAPHPGPDDVQIGPRTFRTAYGMPPKDYRQATCLLTR